MAEAERPTVPADTAAGSPLVQPPSVFSPAFHYRFLPHLLAYCYRRNQARKGQREHVYIEIPIFIALCVFLLMLGLPSAVQSHAVAGIVLAALGGGGIVALIAWAVSVEYRSRKKEGYRYGYDVFLLSVFGFCVNLGLSTGLMIGGIGYENLWACLLGGLAGLVTGYILGLYAGRWAHAFGFMTPWLVFLSSLGCVLLPIEDLIVVLVVVYK
jgi:hypothetical protein